MNQKKEKMSKIDLGSRIDVTSRLSRTQSRKAISEIFNANPNFIAFSKHGLAQMKKRDLTTVDVVNVLNVGKILVDPELENGSWRYRVETKKITVIIAFRKPNHLVVVTAWRN
jgi:hypothetical protein